MPPVCPKGGAECYGKCEFNGMAMDCDCYIEGNCDEMDVSDNVSSDYDKV